MSIRDGTERETVASGWGKSGEFVRQMFREAMMVPGTVADISDDELLRRAVRNCRHLRGRWRIPLWSVVASRFALGSTYAGQLCRRFDLDPEEMVRAPASVSR